MNKGYGSSIQLGTWQQHQQAIIKQQEQQRESELSLGSPLSSLSSSSKSHASKLSYSQPTVTYAQPIIEKVDMTPPIVEKQLLTAETIVQPVSWNISNISISISISNSR